MSPKPDKGQFSVMGVKSYALNDKEFDAIRTLVKEKTGISLGLHKRDLVVSRLAKRLRSLELGSFKEYIQILQDDPDGQEIVHMINRITTNKTDFYREKHHFDYMTAKLLPALYQRGESTGKRKIRVWSSASSSGEEPYTIAITMSEFFKDRPGWDWKILATDLDTTMLSKASKGEYEERLLEPVPRPILNKYFTKLGKGPGALYKVIPQLREKILFRKFNLMSAQYPFRVELDFIFCRNVLIYFENKEKLEIVTKMHHVLAPEGHIFVGHSESLMMAKDLYNYVGTTIYVKK